MLNIYTAKTFEAADNGVLKKLKENLVKEGRHIVIVPENFTLSGEKIIYDKLKTNGMNNLTISSFTNLAEKTLALKKNYLSKAGSIMLFTKAVLLNADKLIKYKNCKKMSGFYKEMFEEIQVIRNSGIKAEELKNLDLPSLTELKVKDIVTLYEGYTKLLEENYYDTVSLYEQFANTIEDDGLFTDCYFYILDYYFFTKVQYDIIEKLAKYSKGVSISLPLNNGKNERIFPVGTIEKLQEITSKIGCKVEIYGENSNLSKEFDHLVDNMFSYEKCAQIQSNKIEIYQNENIEEEVEFACIKIKKDILEGKCRYLDYALILGDLDSYVPVVKKYFTKYNIPFFIDKKEPLITMAGTRFLLDSIKAVINNFDKDYMLKIASNPYSNINKEDYNCFDNYILKYGINYSRFETPFEIAKEDVFFEGAERVRSKIIDMLSVFTTNDTNREYIESCRAFLTKNEFLKRTNDFMDKEIQFKNEFYLPITKQMYEKIYDVLDEYEEILGDEESTLEEFSITLENMYNDIEIGLVPVYVDSVYLGITTSMYQKVKNMIVLGANQGQIPVYQKEKTILNNNDLELMLKNEIYISPTPKMGNNNALFYILELLAMPTNKLIVSYNEQLGSSSDIIRELKYLFSIKEQRFNFNISDIYLESGEDKVKELLPSIISTYANMKKIIIADSSNGKVPKFMAPYNAMYSALTKKDKDLVVRYINFNKKVTKIANADKLYFTKDYTYVSQLENFFHCPYKHFMDYGLNLKDRKEAKISNLEIGNIIHEVLEIFFTRNKDFSLTTQEIESKVNEIFDEISKDPETHAILERTPAPLVTKLQVECRETCKGLVSRLKYTKFVPYKFEVSFGYKGGNDSIKIQLEDKTIKFIGKIDRIDRYNNRIMIIDYKTGSSISSKLQDVYCGKKIQLYMYLSALLLQHKEYKPAGVYYQPISIRYSDSENLDRYKYLGQTNVDSLVMKDIDYTIDEGSESVLIEGLKKIKNGNLSKNSLENCLSDKEFEQVCDYVNRLSTNACEEIKSGYIEATPYDGTCQYCEYAGVCGFNLSHGRKVQKVGKDTILGAVK